MPDQLHVCRRFTGRNLHKPPQELGEGEMTVCDNLLTDGGDLMLRPGLSGQLTTPYAAPVYAPLAYLTADSDGAQTGTEVVHVSSGRIYKWNKGDAATAELAIAGIGAGSTRGSTAHWARLGHYAYLVDGQAAQPMVRLDLNGGEAATALSPPTAGPTGVLGSQVVHDLLLGWTGDTLTSALTNQIVNGTFTDPTPGRVQHGWTGMGPTVDFHNPATEGGAAGGVAGTWDLVDDPGEGLISTDPILNFTQTLDSTRMATQFFLSIDAFNLDSQGRGGYVSTVIAYDSGGVELARKSHQHLIPSTGARQTTYTEVFSFGELNAEIASWKVMFVGDAANQIGNSSVYVGNIVGYPTRPAPYGEVANGVQEVNFYQAIPGVNTAYVAGYHMRMTFGSAIDLSKTAGVAIGLGIGVANLSGLGFKLRFQPTPGGAWYDTNQATIEPGGLSAYVDITTLGLSASALSSIGAMEIVFASDISYTGSATIPLGPMTAAGNLSIVDLGAAGGAAQSIWAFTEVDASADPAYLVNVVESDPSPLSAAFSPTTLLAQIALALPAKTNASATHYRIYRLGGVFSDGAGRLVGTVSLSADGVIGGDAGLSSWNHATLAFSDNTPDSYLQANTIVYMTYGREPPPIGAQAIASWQGRIWLAVKGKLSASWAVTMDEQDALYFNTANLPGDPLNAIKGIQFSVGQDDSDPILALIPMGSPLLTDNSTTLSQGALVVVKQHSLWMVTGTNPDNFAVRSYLVGTGVGGAAPNAQALVDGVLWFLSKAGVREFSGNRPGNASLSIEEDMHPVSGAAMSPSALAAAVMVYHDLRVHLFAPKPGDSANTICHVWDSRSQGWTRYLNPSFLPGVTGAASLSSQTDVGDLVICGSDGQIYLQSPGSFVDKAQPTSSGAPIPFAMKTRGMGQEQEGLDYFRANKPLRLYLDVLTQESIVADVTIDNEAGNVWTQDYTLIGLDAPLLRVADGATGVYHIAGLGGSASTATRIKSIALSSVETRVRR